MLAYGVLIIVHDLAGVLLFRAHQPSLRRSASPLFTSRHILYFVIVRKPPTSFFFFLNDRPPPEFYPLPLPAALPIPAAPHPHLRGAEPRRDVVAFLGPPLHAGARRAGQLAAVPDLELHAVHRGAERDLEQRHGVADANVRARPRDDRVAHGEILGRQDVALLAVRVEQQGDARRPVRVVFDRRHLGRHAELLAPEVDAAILPLVAAAPVPRRDVAFVVAAAGATLRLEQRLLGSRFRDLPEVRHRE